MVRETWSTSFPKYSTSGISCVVLDMQDAETEYDNYYKNSKHEMDLLVDIVAEIMNCSNAFDYNREAVKNFLRYTENENARELAAESAESGSDEIKDIKYKILQKIEAELLEQVPEDMQMFLTMVVTKTVFEGAWANVKVGETFSTLCEAWLSMLSGHTHNLVYKIGGIDFDAMIVCLAPQLYKLLSDADTVDCQSSYLAKLNHVQQVIYDVKKFQCDHVVVAKEEVSSILKPLTDELISRSDEAQQAIFNECERDALAKLDFCLGNHGKP